MPLSRRKLLIGTGVTAVVGAAVYAGGGDAVFYDLLTEDTDVRELSADAAHDLASSGDLLLLDIRRPDEWAATGSPASGVRLDMRREDFVAELKRLSSEDPERPVAIICARGVRSARLSNILVEAGFSDIINVPEGMLGSADGPGWISRGLPLDES